MKIKNLTASEALERLKAGNNSYVSGGLGGDFSADIRAKTAENGQTPYAVVVACSDSRVVPESIFDAGLGELFVIRVAGNVISEHQLGSIEYAAEHLGCRLVLILGHDHCGAVGAAISGGAKGFTKSITDEIRRAIGPEKDDLAACRLNVLNSVSAVRGAIGSIEGLEVRGAIYRLKEGRVEFLR